MIDTRAVAKEIKQEDFCQVCRNTNAILKWIQSDLVRAARIVQKYPKGSHPYRLAMRELAAVKEKKIQAQAIRSGCKH